MDLFDLAVANKLAGGGGGGDIDVDALNVTENGVYSASSGHAFDPVTVSVPQGVFPSGTSSITANGIYDITSFASVDVNVSGGGGITADDIAGRTISGVVSGSTVTRVGAFAFASCSYITDAIFPNVTTIERAAFSDCTSLATASFPNVTTIGSSAFAQCSKLAEADFSKVAIIEGYVFSNCVNLSVARFKMAEDVRAGAFYYCKKLESLYLLASSVATLSSKIAFNQTPMSASSYLGRWGSIYVPASLVNNYKTATNWSLFADRITSYTE